MNPKIGIAISFIGFLVVGVLLLTNHWGWAIKITNYVFYLLVLTFIWFKYNAKKIN
jgi:hypothetical protein